MAAWRFVVACLMAFGSIPILVAALFQVHFVGPDGERLPFENEDAVLDFLRTAEVIDEETIGEGVNDTVKVTLERDGVRANGVFRTVSFKRANLEVGERIFTEFRDSYRYECAAYELSRVIGLGRVPPAVKRTLDGREGSLQLWIHGSLDETEPDFKPPEAGRWARQLWSMYLFDNLVFNIDRNSGNILVDPGYDLWLIDHTRAFQLVPELLDERVMRVERVVWERLRSLTEYELQTRLGEHLDARELQALLRRRERLVAHIESLVAERGEALVLY